MLYWAYNSNESFNANVSFSARYQIEVLQAKITPNVAFELKDFTIVASNSQAGPRYYYVDLSKYSGQVELQLTLLNGSFGNDSLYDTSVSWPQGDTKAVGSSANLTSVSAGSSTFTFTLMRTENAEETGNPLLLVTVSQTTTPIWRRWWFYVLVIGAAAILIVITVLVVICACKRRENYEELQN